MFYRKENESVVFNGKGYMIFYVPEDYFESDCAIITGNYINLLGVFNYAIFDDNDKPVGRLKMFNFPSAFLSQPSEVTKQKDIKLTQNSDKQDYRLLKFKDGDKIIVQDKVPQDIENVEDFFKIFIITGKSPDTISYLDAYKPFLDSIAINGNSYNVSNQLFGILISEIYRDKEDKSKPFRLSKAKKDKDWTNYSIVSIKEVPNYSSPYIRITAENFDDSIIQASMMKDNKIKSSPLEKIFTGK
jgi:hypothetical protein